MSHWFTIDEVGLTRLFLDLALVNVQFSHLGSFRSIVRFFPFFNKNGRTNGLLLLSLSLPMIGFLLVALFYLLFDDFMIQEFSDGTQLWETYYWGIIPFTFFLLYNNIFETYLQAHSNTVFASFLKSIFVRVLTMFALFLYYLEIIDFSGFMVFFIFSYCLNILLFISHLIYNKMLDFKVNPAYIKKRVLRVYFNFSLYSILSDISATLVTKIDGIMLASLLGLSAGGIYSIAVYISILLYIPSSQISKIAFPIIADAWRKKKIKKIDMMYKKTSLHQLIAGGIIFVIVWASIDNFYALQKEEYALGKYAFFFLGISKIINMSFGINGQIINVSKYYRFDTLTSILLAVITIGTNFIFIPLYGLTGAAIATTISLFLFNYIRYVFIKKKLNIQPFSIKTLYIYLILMAGIVLGYLIPDITNIYLDTIVKTFALTLIMIVPIIYFKLSEDIDKIYRNLKLKLFS